MTKPDANNGAGLPVGHRWRRDFLTAANRILEYGALLAEELGSDGSEAILSDLANIRQSAERLAANLGALLADDEIASGSESIPYERSKPCLNSVGEPNDRSTADILVVDDVEANREILARRLQRQGYRIVMAEEGRKALDRLSKEPFDLILLDIMMPVMDGFETLARIKADPALRHIPVIVVSALTDMDSIIACIEAGAEDFLPKPFNPTLLKARIGAALEKKRLREQEHCLLEKTMRVEAALDRHHALTQAVAGVAHEINTPLGIASTGISIIENRFSMPKIQALFHQDREGREWLEDILESMRLIKKNVVRAHKLVENFKKISVNQVLESKETVNLTKVINESIDLYKLSAEHAKLSFELNDAAVKTDSGWHGYPGYLIQILMNFFQNIERYAYPDGAGGKVQITLSDEVDAALGDRFVLKVSDFGIGIGAEHVNKIFDPFFTTGRGRGGTGLGLSIVKNVVTLALKGSIDVLSVPGEGTSFIVRIPKIIADD